MDHVDLEMLVNLVMISYVVTLLINQKNHGRNPSKEPRDRTMGKRTHGALEPRDRNGNRKDPS